MTNEQRKKAAAHIFVRADQYKICHGCSSLNPVTRIFCDVCSAYKFDGSIENVQEAARKVIRDPERKTPCFD